MIAAARKAGLGALAALALGAPALAQDCRKALALGMDVSGSVDATEYRLQLDGLAGALGHPQVQAALLSMPEAPARLMVFEWSGPFNQRVLAPWRFIRGPGDIAELQGLLRATGRAEMDPSTAIGAAMRFAAASVSDQPCWERTIDLSGDGKHNAGPHPRDLDLPGLTINGLVISQGVGQGGLSGSGDIRPGVGELLAYYQAWVLRGPDSFAEVALGFADFEEAMVRKLLRELEVLAVARRTQE